MLKDEGHHHEAVTSRDELLMIPAKLVKKWTPENPETERRRQMGGGDKLCYAKPERWFATTAPQLDLQQRFERYLCWNIPNNPDHWLPKPIP
ncbi:MAG: hypothetical protein IPP19_11470 [Verrucomicrobia bacterium]|nr:hypothetical protein [Verrucomicrobiota bacterium]